MKSEPKIITFGCRVNTYESEIIRKNACASARSNLVIINTCAVTKEAERQARQAIRRARRENPCAEIVVTGCAAQINPRLYSVLPEVDRVIGNVEKLDPISYQTDAPVLVDSIFSAERPPNQLIHSFEKKTRAFLQVQQGCDHRCTFCIIPFGRGNSRSTPTSKLIKQVKKFLDNGYKEIVLSGVDISSYGRDLPGQPTLGEMATKLLRAVPELPRLRISSIDCIEIDAHLKRLLAENERLMPHLHLSLQSGDNLILKRMKRRHTRSQAVNLCEELRRLRPDIVFGADLIAGFPTESELMFQNTLSIVEECGLTWLHVFPYSERPGTPAALMPQVEPAKRKIRAARLRRAGKTAEIKFCNRLIGMTQNLFMESASIGRTKHFASVRLLSEVIPGSILPAKIIGIDAKGKLIAEPTKGEPNEF